MNNKKLVTCPCGSTECKEIFQGVYNRLYISNYRFKILKCQNCGLARSYPVPSKENITKKGEYVFQQNLDECEKSDFWAQFQINSVKKLEKRRNYS